jgi:ribose-phosphate pyrophosphokinase
LEGDFAQKKVLLVQSLSDSANDNLMELLMLAEKVSKSAASKIIVLIPYFAYSRQDKQGGARSLVLKLLKSCGVNAVITLDVHSNFEDDAINGLFSICPLPLFLSLYASDKRDEVLFVFPDKGSFKRINPMLHDLRFALMTKTRLSDGSCMIDGENQELFQGQKCIIIDDVVDSANTVFSAVEFLRKCEAKSVEVCATHGILSRGAIDLIEKSFIDKLYLTNSCSLKVFSPKIKVINIQNLVADFIITNFC